MIQLILSWITGGGATKIVDRLADAYEAKQKAETSKQKIAADVAIERLNAQLAAQVQGDASWLPKAVRAAFGAITLAYLAKLVIWDTVLGMGATNALGGFADWTMRAVVVFYFLDGSLAKLRR